MSDRLSALTMKAVGLRLLLALCLAFMPAIARANVEPNAADHQSRVLVALDSLASAKANLPEASPSAVEQGESLDRGGDSPADRESRLAAHRNARPARPCILPPATAPPSVPAADANQARAPPRF